MPLLLFIPALFLGLLALCLLRAGIGPKALRSNRGRPGGNNLLVDLGILMGIIFLMLVVVAWGVAQTDFSGIGSR